MKNTNAQPSSLGFLATLMAFTLWGCLTAYWNWLKDLDMFTVLSHRAIWLEVFVFVTLAIQGRLHEISEILEDRRTTARIAISGIMIALNWLFFYYSVESGRVLEGSLGEYMSPLMTILLGRVVLREKLSWPQCIAVMLLCVAISNSIVTLGEVPWLPLAIGAPFALYGLFRRGVKAKPLPSLFIETATILPLAIGYLMYRKGTGHMLFDGAEASTLLFLLGSGIATGLPVLFFAYGAPRVKMTSVGIMQYLTPTLTLLFGVILYSEPLSTESACTFALIWTGIVIYTLENLRQRRRFEKNAHHASQAHA